MNASRRIVRAFLTAGLALLAAASALAVRRTEEPLALVPADAATVAVFHWNELRTSPLGAQVFSQLDNMSVDGDAARFLRETGLAPREDIDTIVVAMSPGADGPEDGIVFFEGRFDLARIAGALVERGATKRTGPSGEYYRLARERGDRPGAVALANRTLLIAGSEPAVVAALARRESGGTGGLMSGQGLGKQLSRVDQDASAWALVDLTRMPARPGHGHEGSDAADEPSRAIVGAMKSVTLLALQAKVHGDGLDVSATGLTADAEKRGLLEDSLRGLLAMWRLAVSEKSPELVSVLRGFRIENDSEGVSISGTLPGTLLRTLARNRSAAK